MYLFLTLDLQMRLSYARKVLWSVGRDIVRTVVIHEADARFGAIKCANITFHTRHVIFWRNHNFVCINLVMPVAVDRTPDMGASSDKGNVGDLSMRDPILSEKVKNARPQRSPKKAREVVEVQQPVAGSSTEAVREDGSVWAWRTLTESSASKVKPVFTKDGRCAGC